MNKRNINGREKKICADHLVKNEAPVLGVYLFIRSVLLKLIPPELLGSKHNLNCFLKQVKKLLAVQHHGKISLLFITNGLKTKVITWLRSYDLKQQKEKLDYVVHYLITRVISPLLQSFFHITESTTNKNKLYFYRKKTWQKLTLASSEKFKHLCQLKMVTKQSVENRIKNSKCLGVSKVRFLVKKSAVRPIFNLSYSKKHASINQHLRTLLHVLTYERDNSPEMFGSSVMGLDEVHLKWRDFVGKFPKPLKQKLYFVKLDLEKCFDTINPCLLFGIVADILKKAQYKVYRYKRLITISGGQRKSVYFESLHPPSEFVKKFGEKIVSNGSYLVTKETLLQKLCALLFYNVTKLGKQHYVQTVGIPQGSVVSTLLCAAYYGHMDRTMLSLIQGRKDLLIRMVDDMLYVTPVKENAELLLKIFLEGIPEFNCRSNLKKCSINFKYSHPVFGRVPNLVDSQENFIRFCGLAFDTTSLSVSLDFSNYNGLRAKDTISWELTKHAGTSFKTKMLSSVRPKSSSIVFDKQINSETTIYQNIGYIFALSAVKFHCLIMHLPVKQRASSNPKFFASIIESLPKTLILCVSRKLRRPGQDNGENVFPVPAHVVRLICYQTFLFKLNQHHNVYSALIQTLSKTCPNKSKQLNRKIIDLIPQFFNNIYVK